MRVADRSNLPSCLMSTWIMSPGALPLVSAYETRSFGVKRFFSRPRPRPFMSPDQRWRGAHRDPGDADGGVQRWCRRSTAWLELLCGSSVRRWCGETLRPIRQCRYAACCPKPERATLVGVPQG